MNIGSFVRFDLNSDPNVSGPSFYVGPFFRIVGADKAISASSIGSDAAIAALRFDWKGFSMGASYDINVSSLKVATGGNGGPEFSLAYIGNLSSRKSSGKITCPRF